MNVLRSTFTIEQIVSTGSAPGSPNPPEPPSEGLVRQRRPTERLSPYSVTTSTFCALNE
jgi:hypothetical protein